VKKETIVMRKVDMICKNMNWQKENILSKSKILLQIYRDVVWATKYKASVLREDTCNYFNGEINTVLMYLNEFAPIDERQTFETKVRCLFENKWMINLINEVVGRVRDYPTNGEIYFDIISKAYLSSDRYSESELLSILNVDRSTFYKKKKEAVMIFGIALWGYKEKWTDFSPT